jgi:polysaccharide export outer membrane protein
MKLAERAWSAAVIGTLIVTAFFANAPGASAQERDRYILGESTRLEILVHIMGEVASPGEYRVPDNTNVLELISKAGGPTQFARLNSVAVKRGAASSEKLSENQGEVVWVNINDYLTKENARPVPVLQPGDVVTVRSNSWSTWKTVFGMARDVSVVVSMYILYYRTFQTP